MSVNRRDVGIAILLSIITCGIYGFYWLFCLNEETNKTSNEQNPTAGVTVVILTIFTGGIYGAYWSYKQAEKLDRAAQIYNLPQKSNSILYLILSAIGLSPLAYALMQDQLNDIADIQARQMPQVPYGQNFPQQPQAPYGQNFPQQ